MGRRPHRPKPVAMQHRHDRQGQGGRAGAGDRCNPESFPGHGRDAVDPAASRAYRRTSAWKSAVSRFVTGPGTPAPIFRPSISTTGITSAAVPVRKHSSAV